MPSTNPMAAHECPFLRATATRWRRLNSATFSSRAAALTRVRSLSHSSNRRSTWSMMRRNHARYNIRRLSSLSFSCASPPCASIALPSSGCLRLWCGRRDDQGPTWGNARCDRQYQRAVASHFLPIGSGARTSAAYVGCIGWGSLERCGSCQLHRRPNAQRSSDRRPSTWRNPHADGCTREPLVSPGCGRWRGPGCARLAACRESAMDAYCTGRRVCLGDGAGRAASSGRLRPGNPLGPLCPVPSCGPSQSSVAAQQGSECGCTVFGNQICNGSRTR